MEDSGGGWWWRMVAEDGDGGWWWVSSLSAFEPLLRYLDSSVVRFLGIDHTVSGWNPSSATLAIRMGRIISSL